MNNLVNNLGKVLPLNEEDMEIFISKLKSVTLKKGDFFIREGGRSDFIIYIVKGRLVCSFNINGNEIIDEFAIENQFLSDYKNFLGRHSLNQQYRMP